MVLRSSEYFYNFLTIVDLKEWEQALKKQEKLGKPLRVLQDLVMSDGMCNV